MKKIVLLFVLYVNVCMAQSVNISPERVSKSKSISVPEDLVLSGEQHTPTIFGQRANGTEANKTALLNGDKFFTIGARGYRGSAFSSTYSASISMKATQNWTATAQGSAIDFFTTKNGENIPRKRMTLNHNGRIGIGTSEPEADLHVFQNEANTSASIRISDSNDVNIYSEISHGNGTSSIINNGGIGIQQFVFGGGINIQTNGVDFLDSTSANVMSLSPIGNLGLGALPTANAKLLVSSGISGVTGSAATKAIFEDDSTHFMGIFCPEGSETGIAFGKPSFGAFSGGIIYDAGSNLNFRTNTNDTRMTLSSAGHLGVGVSPVSRFHVANGLSGVGSNIISSDKTMVIESNTNTSLVLAAPTGENISIGLYRPTLPGSSVIIFNQNNSINLDNKNVIAATGNIGIGDFSTNLPEAKLHVDGDYAFKKKKLLSGNGGHSDEPRNGASVISIATPANGGGGETLGGLSDGIEGLLVYIYPVQGTSLTISNESTSSIAANRILTKSGGNLVLSNDGGVTLMYDANVSRWRVVGVAN